MNASSDPLETMWEDLPNDEARFAWCHRVIGELFDLIVALTDAGASVEDRVEKVEDDVKRLRIIQKLASRRPICPTKPELDN